MNMKRALLVLFLVLAVVGVVFAQSTRRRKDSILEDKVIVTLLADSFYYFEVENDGNTHANVVITYTSNLGQKTLRVTVRAKQTEIFNIGKGTVLRSVVINDVKVTR